MVEWKIAMELRLRELAAEGLQGQDIAAMVSAEFGEFFSVDSVFHKASRLGISLRGRASALEPSEGVRGDPFGVPSWLEREIQKVEVEKHKRPHKVVCLGWTDSPDEISDEAIKQRATEAWDALWGQYVSDVLRKGKCTSQQADAARKRGPPTWFRRWAEVDIVIAWDVGRRAHKRAL